MSTNVCLDDIPWTIHPFVTKLGMVVLYHERVMRKNWFAVFKVKVTARAYIIRMWLLLSELLTLSQLNLVWYYILLCWSVTYRKVDYCVQKQGRSETSKVNDFVSGQCFLNYCTVYYQTWYNDVSSWARVKIMVCCLKGQGHNEGVIWSNYDSVLCLLNCCFFCNQT